MKKMLLITLFVSALLFMYSCGEKKEEVNQDTDEQMVSTDKLEDEQMKSDEMTESEEKMDEEETKTEMGDAPKKEAQVGPSTDFSKNPLKCRIVAFDDVATGNFRKLTKPQAKDLAAKGKMLVVIDENNRVFVVYNEDGTIASNNLAKYAANEYIGILGKYKKVNGVNVIIASMIESLD